MQLNWTLSFCIQFQRVPNRIEATRKAVLRAVELFLLGVILQGSMHYLTFSREVKFYNVFLYVIWNTPFWIQVATFME
jgi:hypothetical protein